MKIHICYVVFIAWGLAGCSTLHQRIASNDPVVYSKASSDFNASSEDTQLKTVRKLARDLNNTNNQVKMKAVCGLKRIAAIGSPVKNALPELIQALNDDAEDVRRGSAEILSELGPEARDATSALLQSLGDSAVSVRENAIRALGSIGSDEIIIPALIKSLSDFAPRVKEEAIDLLRRFGPNAISAVPELIKTLTDPDPKVRELGDAALREIDPIALSTFREAEKIRTARLAEENEKRFARLAEENEKKEQRYKSVMRKAIEILSTAYPLYLLTDAMERSAQYPEGVKYYAFDWRFSRYQDGENVGQAIFGGTPTIGRDQRFVSFAVWDVDLTSGKIYPNREYLAGIWVSRGWINALSENENRVRIKGEKVP